MNLTKLFLFYTILFTTALSTTHIVAMITNHKTQPLKKKNLEQARSEHMFRAAAKHNDTQTLHHFIQRGIDINAQDDITKNTALHEAIEHENQEAVSILGAHGANVNIRNHKGFTPLDITNLKHNISLLYISRAYNANDNSLNNYTQWCQQTEKKLEKTYQEHLLRIAAEDNDQESLKYFIQLGVNINAQTNKTKYSALHEAVEHGNIETTHILLEHGANVNIQDCKGFTPLHIAIMAQSMPLVHLLLGYNADTTIKNKNHYYPDNYIKWYPNGASRKDETEMIKNQFSIDSHPILLCARLEKILETI